MFLRQILVNILLNYIFDSFELTAMIYMRDRANEKKAKVQNTFKKNIIEELKNKMSQVAQEKKSNSPLREEHPDVQNRQAKEPSYQTYKIAKRQQETVIKSKQPSLNDQKLCESIVVDEGRKSAFSRKGRSLNIEKSFDIQIQNSMRSRVTLQDYVKLVQKQNQNLKSEVAKVRFELQRAKVGQGKANQSKIVEQLQFRLLQQKVKNSQNDLTLTKYQKYFNECKSLLLNAAMELIQAKNTLGLSMSTERLVQKQHQLARCLQKMEKMISIYSLFLQQGPKELQQDHLALEQLNCIVKYQQKTIEKLTDSKHCNNYQYQNGLLRYEINRLSKQNQVIMSEFTSLKESLKKGNIHKTVERRQSKFRQGFQESCCQTDEKQENQTPIGKLGSLEESIKSPFEAEPKLNIEPKYSIEPKHSSEPKHNIEPKQNKKSKENLLKQMQSQLEQQMKIITNLEIEKDYISDQLMSVEKDMNQLKAAFREAIQEKQRYFADLELLKEQYVRLENENTIAQEQFSAQDQTIGLLKEKIRQLEEHRQPRENSKYVELLSGNENVTVEILLKFLKRKELAKYHQALMQLINKYEARISELNSEYIQQKTKREQLFNFCRGLTSMVNSQSRLSLQKVLGQINKFHEKVEQVRENQVDRLLRKVKCFSIGIDRNELSNIQLELQEYILQLQSRLPTLSEAYLEDGSSVADSCHSSIQHFQI